MSFWRLEGPRSSLGIAPVEFGGPSGPYADMRRDIDDRGAAARARRIAEWNDDRGEVRWLRD